VRCSKAWPSDLDEIWQEPARSEVLFTIHRQQTRQHRPTFDWGHHLPSPSQYLQRKTGLNSQINEERATAHFTVESAQMFPADKNIWNRPLASEFFKLLTGQRVNFYVDISPLFIYRVVLQHWIDQIDRRTTTNLLYLSSILNLIQLIHVVLNI
jgi:hypothetical protein